MPQTCTLEITPLLWGSVTSLGGSSLGLTSLFCLLHQELAFILIISRITYQQKQHGTWQCFTISIKTASGMWGPQMFRQDISNTWGIRLGDLEWDEVPYPNPHCSHAWEVCVHWCVNRWVKCIGQIQKHYSVCANCTNSLYSFLYLSWQASPASPSWTSSDLSQSDRKAAH